MTSTSPTVRDEQRTRLFATALAIIFVVGVLFRSMRYWIDPIALWGDEAGWATRLLTHSWHEPSFRPIAFMGAVRLLTHVAVDERLLRLPSYLASLVSLYLFYDVGRRLIRAHGALLLMMAVVAAQPMLIDFAKEFKPYSVEIFVHLLLVSRALRYDETRSRRDLAVLLCVTTVSFFFAYNVIFVFPTLFLLLAVWSVRSKQWRRLIVVCGVAATCVAAILAMNFMVFRHISKHERSSEYWGKKYDVFFLDKKKQTQVRWQLEKLEDLVAMPGAGRESWQRPRVVPEKVFRELGGLEWLGWVVLYVVGAVALARRRHPATLALLLGPIATVMLFNVVKLWPWGSFRTNLFLLAYIIPVPFTALSWIRESSARGGAVALAGAFVLQLCPLLVFGFGLHTEKRTWTGHNEMPRILEILREERDVRLKQTPNAPKETVLLDWYTCGVYEFYLHDIVRTKPRHEAYFGKNFAPRCTGYVGDATAALRRSGGKPTWVIISNPDWVEQMKKDAAKVGHITREVRPAYNHLLLLLEGAR